MTDPNHPTNQQQKQDGGGSFEERIVYAGHPRVAHGLGGGLSCRN